MAPACATGGATEPASFAVDHILGPDCLRLLDTSGTLHVWPMSHGAHWRAELEKAQVFFAKHTGIQIVTAVGR